MLLFKRLLMGAVLFCGATLSHAGVPGSREEVYFFSHEISVDGPMGGVLRQQGFNSIALQPGQRAGTRMHSRVLWAMQRGVGQSSGTLTLDPDDTDDAALLKVLEAGFVVDVQRDGRVGRITAVDNAAWTRLVEHNPRAARLSASHEQLLGMRPLALPARLRVGQEIVQRGAAGTLGEITTRMRVVQLNEDAALFTLALEGGGLRGTGRQAVRLADSLPIEARIELEMDARPDGTPAHTQRLHLANMAFGPDLVNMMDAQAREGYSARVREILGSAPFTAISDDAAHYGTLSSPVDALEPTMLPVDALPGIERELLFLKDPDYRAARPLLTIGGQMGAKPRGPDVATWDPPQIIVADLRKVELLDARQQVVPGTDAHLLVPTLVTAGNHRVGESEAAFPFRLPLGLRAEQLAPVETIRMHVAVTTQSWDRTETVQAGEQSAHNTGARIDWTAPWRVTVEQRRASPDADTGQFTLAIALDEAGNEIPSAQFEGWRVLDPPSPDVATQPLLWEHSQAPIKLEIATSRPIAALQLRHFRWERVPRQWTFRKAAAQSPGSGLGLD